MYIYIYISVYIEAFGPKQTPSVEGFWAILSLRVRVDGAM